MFKENPNINTLNKTEKDISVVSQSKLTNPENTQALSHPDLQAPVLDYINHL